MKGKIYRPWPKKETIKLLNCIFAPGQNECDFFIQTVIKAENQEQAESLGQTNCKDSVNFFEFCIGEQIKLNNMWSEINEENNPMTHCTAGFRTLIRIKKDKPFTSDQLNDLTTVQNTINQNGETQEILNKSIHWRASGNRESDRSNRFIKYWVSLEIMFEGNSKETLKKIKKSLIKLYPQKKQEKINEVIGKLYYTRKLIVHEGLRNPEEVINYTEQLKAILDDLLRSRLNLQFQAKANKYFI